MYTKIGEVAMWDVIRDSDGDVGLTYGCSDEDCQIFYLSIKGYHTVDERLAELRAACTDPRDRVIEAAREYVANIEPEDGDVSETLYAELARAVEAL